MARDFDGVNDSINFGSDASVDDFTAKSIAAWTNFDATGTMCIVAKSGPAATWEFRRNGGGTSGAVAMENAFSGTDAIWRTGTGVVLTGRFHIVFTHDGTTGAPLIYVNNVSQSITTVSTPTGTIDADAANDLRAGTNASDALDLDGQLQSLCYDNSAWTAEQVNRSYWWGRPGGGVEVYHPMLTDKLANEGTATATGTATGTTVVSLVTPVVRPGSAMMGMGVGW